MDNLQKANEQVLKAQEQAAANDPAKMSSLLHLSGSLCEKCSNRHRRKDKKWCGRCIDIHNRRRTRTPEVAERTIAVLVESLYIRATLKDLEPVAREKLLSLADDRDVFMFGPVGTGKTHAMAALIRLFVYEGFECRRINFDDFCVDVRSTMSPAATITEKDMIKPMKEVDKLFIDDLGIRSKQETDFAYVTLYSILNKRQERRLPTFISSNKNIEQLGQQFDARIASRLSTAEIIELTGKDRRQE